MKCSRMAVGRPQLALECAPHGEGMKNVDNRHAWVTRLAEFATRNRRTPQHTSGIITLPDPPPTFSSYM